MENIHQTLLHENHYYLMVNLELNEIFLSVLKRSETLLPDHLNLINGQKYPEKKIDKFLWLLPKRGSTAFVSFLDALSQSNQQIIKENLMECLKKPVLHIQESFDYTDHVVNIERSMLLINISNNSDKNWDRKGSMKDLADIKEVFVNQLNYKLFQNDSHQDLNGNEIINIVKDFVRQISPNSKTKMVFIIMCHGEDDNYIRSQDKGLVKITDIIKCFRSDRIIDVFKIMVFACCRGSIRSEAVSVSLGNPKFSENVYDAKQVAATVNENRKKNYTKTCDLGCFGPLNSIVFYSTLDNYVAYRNPKNGTIFIQSLLSVLKTSAKKKPIRLLVPDIKCEMKKSYEDYNQISDIKENYSGDIYF